MDDHDDADAGADYYGDSDDDHDDADADYYHDNDDADDVHY